MLIKKKKLKSLINIVLFKSWISSFAIFEFLYKKLFYFNIKYKYE